MPKSKDINLQTSSKATKTRDKAPARVRLTKTLSKVAWGGGEGSDFQYLQGDTFEGMRYVKDQSVALILADLPYGKTKCKWDSVIPLDLLWAEYMRVLKPNGVVLLTASVSFAGQLIASNLEWYKYLYVWKKPNGTNPMQVKTQPFRDIELIVVFYKKQPTFNPQMVEGGEPYSGFCDDSKHLGEVHGTTLISKHRDNPTGERYTRCVLEFGYDKPRVHPTQKPLGLMSHLIRTYTNKGDLVLDNTMGSGTTGVGCIQYDRRFFGVEREPKYFETAIKRIEENDPDK